MKCSFCGGAVSWVGNLIDNPSTQCADCGRRNCQEVEPSADGEDEPDWEHPCPFRGEPTMTPAGESCSACGLRESDINDSAAGVAGTPAHSKSEYKRRVSQGDANVLPPAGVEVDRG